MRSLSLDQLVDFGEELSDGLDTLIAVFAIAYGDGAVSCFAIAGHEFSGRVAALGKDVSGFEVGAIVASGAGISCGECFQCRAGRTNICLSYSTIGLHRDGALAQYVAVPATTCIDGGSRRCVR